MKFTFGQVFLIALCGAAFALTGAWLAIRGPGSAVAGMQMPVALSSCKRIAAQPNAVMCSATLPVYVYRAPQTETPAVAAAGVW